MAGLLALLLAGLLLGHCAPADPTPRFRNLVLIIIDTLRSDHLPSYGYGRDTAPFLARLASEGVQMQGYSVASWTRPSIASILTGLQPQRHQTFSRSDHLPDRVTLLAEVLAEQGFATASYVGNPNAGRRWGFDRGVEHYAENPSGKRGRAYRVAIDRTLALAERLETPFFLSVLFVEPHDPYKPDEPWLDETVDETWRYVQPQQVRRRKDPFDPVVLDHLERQYDGEIRDVDRHIERLVGELDRAGLLDDTLVVVTADHGEEFGEHGDLTHGKSLYEEVVRVPFITWSRRGLHPAQSDARFYLLDFLPTVCHALRVEPPEGLDGVDRWPTLVQGVGDPQQPIFFHLDLDKASRAGLGILVGDTKLLHRLKRPKTMWTDLATDPTETAYTRAATVESQALLKRLIAHHNAEAERLFERRKQVTDEATRRDLAALGYLKLNTPEEQLERRFIPDRLDPEKGLSALKRGDR